MPSRNVLKPYTSNTYYHIYNRGVEKRQIFLDDQDCHVFLRYIKLYLSPLDSIKKQSASGFVKSRFVHLNMSQNVELVCFALMPNHIHLLVKQVSEDGIIKFMRSLSTSYVMYFNKKYKRTGSLFQGTYKGIVIPTDDYMQHLSGYIHRNPMKITSNIDFLQYSSFPYYMEEREAEWLTKDSILQYFSTIQEYKEFVEGYGFNESKISPFKLETGCV